MHGLSFLFSFFCLTAIGFYGTAIFSAWNFFSRSKQEPDASFLPPVSVLKPLGGIDQGTYENLASYCRQDYPRFQLIFGVTHPHDPVFGVLKRLTQDFPEVDIRTVLCDRVLGANPKISSLIQMRDQARHPFLLVCDSDIRVDRRYLRGLVQPMRDPKIGVVTCMYRSLSKGWVGTLEALRESTEFCPNVLVARQLEGVRFGLGSGILVREEALDQIGGFPAIADHLADDYLLGHRVAQAGYTAVLSREVVEHDLSRMGFVQFLRRQLRWNRGIRVCRPWGYRGLILTYGIPFSLLLLAVTGAPWARALSAAVWVSRWAMACVVGAVYLGDRSARKFWVWAPVQDGISFGLWCAGLFGDKVYWRGRFFRLTAEGKLKDGRGWGNPTVSQDAYVPVAH